MSKIRKTMPRDQSQTGKYYDFQHAETARGCLRMLKEGHFNHVFCEWHDDFVEVRSTSGKEEYTFCQVKGKKLTEARFNFKTMFGLSYSAVIKKDKKPPSIDPDAILYKQLLLYIQFKTECEKFKVLTNYEFGDNIAEFLDYMKNPGISNPIYDFNLNRLHSGYSEILGAGVITVADLKHFFSIVELIPNCNLLTDFKIMLYHEISYYLDLIREVPFSPKNIHRMIDNLLTLIKKKADDTIDNIPSSEVEILSRKAILLTDVLEYIGVSRDIFIKLEGQISDRSKAIIASSRLERFAAGKDPALIKDFLNWKTDWDLWMLNNKSTIRPVELMAIKRIFSGQMPKAIAELDIEAATIGAAAEFLKANIVFDNDTNRNENLIIGGLLATIIEFEAPLND